jgi:signal transduction histidine kinase
VRVAEGDALHAPLVRRAVLSLLAVLPLAVLFGALMGRGIVSRQLRPLQDVTRAAAALEPGTGQRVNVPTPTEETARLVEALNHLLAQIETHVARERRFAQQAPHELRTPLTALRIRLEGLRASARLGGAGREIDTAIGELDALDRLIDALLLLAGADEADFPMAPVNLCDLAREAAAPEPPGPGSVVSTVDAPDEILVAGNHDLLSRALANLVDNARKYAGPDPHLRIRAFTDEDQGVLSVEDNGPGIPPEIRPFIFERFYRGAAHRHRIRGSGLGLSVVDTIVRRHRGRVETRRSGLGGEDVRILLPLLDRRSAGA